LCHIVAILTNGTRPTRGSELSKRLLDLPRKRFVILADQGHRLAKCDTDGAWVRHSPGSVQHLFEPLDSDRHDRYPKT
jgi:hypothetical protein